MQARVVSLVEHAVLDFDGSIVQNSIALGDVENNGIIQLAVCDIQGTLHVYKHLERRKASYICHGLGTVLVTQVGCVLSKNRNSIICISAEGQCNIINIDSEIQYERDDQGKSILQPYQTFKCPYNVNALLLLDIEAEENADENGSTRGIKIIMGSPNDTQVYVYDIVQDKANSNTKEPSYSLKLETAYDVSRGVVSLSTTKHKSQDGDIRSLLLVGLQNGGWITIDLKVSEKPAVHQSVHMLSPTLAPRKSAYGVKDQNQKDFMAAHSPTLIVGNVVNEENLAVIALCSLGGMVQIQRVNSAKTKMTFKLISQERLPTQLFAIQACSITGGANDEVVVASWDGLVCIYDAKKHVVRFHFQQAIKAFLAGNFTINSKETKMCFFYVTFDGRIIVYTNVRKEIGPLSSTSLKSVLKNRGELQRVIQALEACYTSQEKQALRSLPKEDYHSYLLHEAIYNKASPLYTNPNLNPNLNPG